tara:strand:+ start:604 stop:801 length:198 start_codon:yes stop_codon:yes gene_type:complete
MGSNRRDIILSIQFRNGGDRPVVFEITQAKLDKILQILDPEIRKERKIERSTTAGAFQKYYEEEN